MRKAASAGSNTTPSPASTRDFIETEVLPRITKDYGVAFTTDPEGRATMGGSSGAACAFTMAWFHPELYRRVLSYSGTYVNQQSPLNPDVTARRVGIPRDAASRTARAKPIRVWMHVSERDNRLRRSGRHVAQLGARQRPHGGRPQGQGLQVSVRRTRRIRATRRSRGDCRRRCPKRSSGSGRVIRSRK